MHAADTHVGEDYCVLDEFGMTTYCQPAKYPSLAVHGKVSASSMSESDCEIPSTSKQVYTATVEPGNMKTSPLSG